MLFELQYLGMRNCIHLESLPELSPNLAKLEFVEAEPDEAKRRPYGENEGIPVAECSKLSAIHASNQ
ncbi:hypothetical protein M5689_019920 [Euphorbia peplus]|nr:hypothetical protein M5689_019920 [Euphorbia peplus]